MKYITHDWEWIGIKALEAPFTFKNPLTIRFAVDVFAEYTYKQLDQIFAVIALTPQHQYQVWTLHPQQMMDYWTKPCGYTDAIMRCGIAYGRESFVRQASFQWWNQLSCPDAIKFPLPNLHIEVSGTWEMFYDLVKWPNDVRIRQYPGNEL